MLRRWPITLASKATPRRPVIQYRNQTSSQRWNSSKSPISRPLKKIPSATEASGKGWTTFRVFGVVVVTAIAAGSFATKQAKFLEMKARDYSSPTKFHEPKYASIREMEAVSIIKHLTLINIKTEWKLGHQGNPTSMW